MGCQHFRVVPIVLSAVLALQGGRLGADGTVAGHGRFEKVKGKPALGHAELYESNLFLSRQGGGVTGPSRRLGAPPGEPARHDGFYSITVPAGSYSILLNQPLFFIRPKVLPDIVIEDGKTVTRNVELPIDFSTYFTDDGGWDPNWDSAWYQTFVATGTSITGLSWKLAGSSATEIRASIHAEGANANPSTWPQVSAAAAKVGRAAALADNWVRWRSGEVPTIPGNRYAVKLAGAQGGDLKFTPFHRAKDGSSYAGGRAYKGAGAAQNYDLNITVFSDNDGTAVLYNKTTLGLGDLRDGYYDTRWGQTFKATMGTSLAAVDAWAAGADNNWDLDFTWTVRKGGPTGTRVGPAKTTKAAYQAFGAGLHGVSYNPGEVPLEAGQVYYIEFTNPTGFNPYVFDSGADAYENGAGYQNGSLKAGGSVDVSMTILVYTGGGGTIRGKVEDAKSSAGLAGASVSVAGLGRSALTDAGGDYELREVPEGTYELRASMPGYTDQARAGVSVTAGQEATADFSLEPAPCGLSFGNPGFETGLSGWTRYGGAKTSNPSGSWFGGIEAAEGLRFWGNEVNGAALGTGGAWQQFCSEPGHRYRATAWSNIYWIEGDSSMARSRIGLDPSGNTDRGATAVWGAWDRQSASATEGWRQIQIEAVAAGRIMTLFLDFEQRDGSGPGNQWRINCFDGALIEDLDAVTAPHFERGDCNGDRATDLTDAVFLLGHLFLGARAPGCFSACDSNDDGSADLSDAVAILNFLFLGGKAPPPPRGSCGEDPTEDALTCVTYEC